MPGNGTARRGRSAAQVAAYEREIEALRRLLAGEAMTVREIRDALAVRRGGRVRKPAAATVYARIAALKVRGYTVRARKRRRKIPGKSGQRERVFSIEASA